jgi:hypothetical protein
VSFQTSSGDPRYDRQVVGRLNASIIDNDPGADLALSIVARPTAPVALNANFDARFRITNSGPAYSPGATFRISPMAGFDYVSNGPGATCTPTAGLLTCTVGPLASGAQVEFAVLFVARIAGTHSNDAWVTGNVIDPLAINNVVPWELTIQ